MEMKIKRIGISDLSKFAVIFENEDIKRFGLLEKDRLEIDEEQFLKEVKS